MFSQVNLTQKHYLANLTGTMFFLKSMIPLTEDLEELKYSLAFIKLLLTEISESRSPKESEVA